MAYEQGSTGGLPASAVARIKDMRGTGEKPKLFTSDLSPSEHLLVREAEFEPLGLVMGSSIYHIGFQIPGQYQSMEMDVLTQAMYHARELAMDRLDEECDLLGADGVVGVRIVVNMQQWGENLAEFMAVGTAIRHTGGGNYRTPRGKPFTSDLSGQDFYTLLKTGFRPVCLAMGTCVYHVAHQGFRQMLSRIGKNVEMENYTQSLYDARELAMTRMHADAEADSAVGIVGARVEESSFGWGSHVIEFFAIGTAVIPIDNVLPAAPSLVLPLG